MGCVSSAPSRSGAQSRRGEPPSLHQQLANETYCELRVCGKRECGQFAGPSLLPTPLPPSLPPPVSVDEVYTLQELFESVSNSHIADGLIHKSEWGAALLGRNPRSDATAASSLFIDRVFAAFDAADNEVVDFPEFVRGLSVFHPSAPHDEKAAFVFKVYDIHRTGVIEKRELRALLAAATADNPALGLRPADLDALVDAAFAAGDAAGDGVIHPREWDAIVASNPGALAFMTLPGLRAVTSRYPGYVWRKNE